MSHPSHYCIGMANENVQKKAPGKALRRGMKPISAARLGVCTPRFGVSGSRVVAVRVRRLWWLRYRDSGRLAATVVASTDAATLQGFVAEHAGNNVMVYTDEHKST